MTFLTIWRFLTSKAGQIVAGIAAVALVLVGVRRSGAKAEKKEAKLKKLEADKATAERMDNAKPAKNADGARANLADWLRGGRK